MNNLYSWLIITFASVLASLLVFIGIKKLPFNVKSKSIFGVILSFFILLNSCNNKVESKEQEKQKSLKKDMLITLNSLNIKKEFKSEERFLKIKKVWKTLNKIEPKENGSYFHTLKENKQAKIRKDLLDAFGYNYYGSLENKDISELEKVLVNLIIKRIDGLTYPREMMMRMMPPPSTGLKNKTILDMEKEIDVLIKLRKSKKISSKEASKVLTRIQNNAYMVCILNIFGNFGFRYSLDLTKVEDLAKIDETIDLWIKKYNDSYNKVLKNVKLQKNYIQQHKVNNKEVQKGFKKIKNLKLKIYNLIEALESN